MISNIFLCIAFCLLADQAQLSTQEAFSNKTLGLSFNCKRNQTGHYITKWFVDKIAQELPNNMKIDLKSSISAYGGSQLFQLQAIITVPPPRPADYELFPGIGYYKFYPKGAASFNEASAVCTNDSAHLAILNSEAEYNVLKTLYGRHPDTREFAYIGLIDNQEGKYVTVFGDPLETTGFTRWKPGEPNNADERCGSIHRNLGLNDLSCDGPWPFFCEYDLSWSEI